MKAGGTKSEERESKVTGVKIERQTVTTLTFYNLDEIEEEQD